MKEHALQVLLVEDSTGDARLLREMLSEEKAGSFELKHLSRMHEAETHLLKGGVDILLLDMGLPDEHGIETVRRAHAAAPNVPMIVLTGLDDEALAAEAMREGAQDYLIKGQIENRALPRALRHAIERYRLQMENETIRAEQLHLKDEFLSHVSHELRSPLTSIYSFGTIIADGLAGATSPQQDEYLKIILRNVRQLQAMIEDLLEVTQVHEGKLSMEPKCASVSDAVTYAVDTHQGVARSKQITISCNSSEHLPSAYADPTRLRQILTILVDNAVKFTPIGGAVSVSSRIFEDDPRFLLVQVCDTGCGIGPKMTECIFEQLYQINDPGQAGRKGLGLGLYIAKELVMKQGGRIWVNSEPQKGSEFCFTVPIFSVASLIGPILNHEIKPGEAIALLTVEISSVNDSQKVQKETLDLAHKLLQRCLRPDGDVLLPSMTPESERERLFVVGYSLAQGAEVISDRIRNRFQDCPGLRPTDFVFTISHSFLEPLSRKTGESPESFARRVADGIEDRIYSTCNRKSVNR